MLRNIFQKITGLYIYQNRPFGIDPLSDLKNRFFKNYQFETFFDIGANEGQSAIHIRNTFPLADIWSFEPILKTFEILKTNTAGLNVKCYQIGLGSKQSSMNIAIDDNYRSDMNSLVNVAQTENPKMETETIRIQKLDDFCAINSVNHIDYLKIDTEGYDLEVLKGAQNFIQNQLASFVEVEVSMNPENTFHVDFVEVKQFMESFGYRLFGIYDQMYEWQTGTPILRRTNPVFVSERVYKKEVKA